MYHHYTHIRAIKPHTSGFTLIELLIVIAIIAILALIAVPNFLEAQTRAKVARVQANMRTMGTAIEAYHLDYAVYPGDPYDWGVWMGQPGSWPYMSWDWPLLVCTTPIAYMNSIPEDPFSQGMSPDTKGLHTWYLTKTGYYRFRHTSTDPAAFFAYERAQFQYCLDSAGPDGYWEFDRNRPTIPHYNGDVNYYDPTNGTMSQGDLYVFGPGNLYNPPPQPTR